MRVNSHREQDHWLLGTFTLDTATAVGDPRAESTGGKALSRQRRSQRTRDRRQLLTYLAGPECGMFRDAPAPIAIADADVDELLAMAGPGTLALVRSLDERMLQFDSFAELLDVVKSTDPAREDVWDL